MLTPGFDARFSSGPQTRWRRGRESPRGKPSSGAGGRQQGGTRQEVLNHQQREQLGPSRWFRAAFPKIFCLFQVIYFSNVMGQTLLHTNKLQPQITAQTVSPNSFVTFGEITLPSCGLRVGSSLSPFLSDKKCRSSLPVYPSSQVESLLVMFPVGFLQPQLLSSGPGVPGAHPAGFLLSFLLHTCLLGSYSASDPMLGLQRQ